MIRTSSVAKIIALTLASTLVVGTAQFAWTADKLKHAGGGVSVEAKMGSAFEDMVDGVLTAEAVDDAPLMPEPHVKTAQQPDVGETQSTPIEATLQPKLRETTPARQPDAATSPNVQLTDAPRTVPFLSAPAPDAVLPAVVSPRSTTATPTPQVMQPITSEPVETAQTPLPSETLQRIEPKPTLTTPTETIAAEEPDSAAPPLSIRPQRRDPEKAARVAATRPKPNFAPKPKRLARRGNAQQNKTRGADSGTNQQAKATSPGQRNRTATQADNAARDNYPGQVMRKISRVRRPSVRARGAAVVSFRVAASGGLAGVSIARSSGSAALDQAALRVVRAAAPFPRPPRGAQRSFSIRIKGS